ncbi:MAG TPA: amidohydrolase family protein [Pyrinomonadaceae bacterium]|nr:amidohydrolase family protein [Pyrinomonadaceae bacterium]
MNAPEQHTTKLYTARWVLPMTRAPIEDGAVAVAGETIVGVGGRDELKGRFPSAAAEDFGEAAILPGLVNCHSHLELTAMRGFLEPEEGNFDAWLRKLTRARLERMTEDDLYVSAAWGACEAARAGVTCVGDASDGARHVMRALKDAGLRGTVFQEVFGPDDRTARERLEGLREKVGPLRGMETPLVRVGVSPHAPYTVGPALLGLVTEYALAENLPLMMHAAESEAEDLLVREGRGPFAEGLARRGIEWRARGASPIQHLAACGVLRARPLLAHCIRVDESDIETIGLYGAGVAHCPKSNAKFGHGHAPFDAFLRDWLPVGLGSDSVASNNTCDLLEEARFAVLMFRARAGREGREDAQAVGPAEALQAATRGGARALGGDTQTGALAEWTPADLAVVALGGAHQTPVYDPAAALVFSSSGRDVLLTVVNGREVYRDGRVNTLDEERLRARVKEIARKLRIEN